MAATQTAARSMLEEMLDALKLREEKPKDVPPALPARPSLKRRPPSTKALPVKFKAENNAEEGPPKDPDVMEEKARPDTREFGNATKVNDRSKMVFADAEKMPEKSIASTPVGEEASNMEHHNMLVSKLEELEKVVLKAKEELVHKEEENVALSQQVQQSEKKWSACEEKMKSMEEMYQKQIENLKMNLAAAQKSLADCDTDTVQQPRKVDAVSYSHGYDSKVAMSADAQTPQGPPTKRRVSETRLSKDADDKNNVVRHLTKEFEQQKQVFEEDARVVTEVKTGQLASITKSIEELQKLKVRYAAWKKEYRIQLHEAKAALKKLGKSEGQKPRRRWWSKKRKAR